MAIYLLYGANIVDGLQGNFGWPIYISFLNIRNIIDHQKTDQFAVFQ